ncbi:hypothetical protein [Actibacterium sp. D379-3]
MTDPGYQEFQGRLRRIERIHRRGGGFEASGTLGRSFYRGKPQRVSLMRPLVLLLVSGLLLKAVLLMQIGEGDYRDRIARLQDGTRVEMIGAYVMQPDQVTVWLADVLGELLRKPV